MDQEKPLAGDWNPAEEIERLAKANDVSVTDALRKAGINTATFRRWKEEPPNTAKVFNSIRQAIIDLAQEKKDADSK